MTGAWLRIGKASELMLVALGQGIKLGKREANIILGYLNGHDYCLMVDIKGKTLRHDEQCGDDHNGDKAYTVRDVIEFCQEMNECLLNDSQSQVNLDKGYLSQLEEDWRILDALLAKWKIERSET